MPLDITGATLEWYEPGEWPARDFVIVGDQIVTFLASDTIPAMRKFTAQGVVFGDDATDVSMIHDDAPVREGYASIVYDSVNGKIWVAVTPSNLATRLLRFDATTLVRELRCFPGSVVTHGGATYACMENHTGGAFWEPGVGAYWGNRWELIADDVCDNTDITEWSVGPFYIAGDVVNTKTMVLSGDILYIAMNRYGSRTAVYLFNTVSFSSAGVFYTSAGFNVSRLFIIGDSLYVLQYRSIVKFTLATGVQTGITYRPGTAGEYLVGSANIGNTIYVSVGMSGGSIILIMDAETLGWTGAYETTDVEVSAGPMIQLFDQYLHVGLNNYFSISDTLTRAGITTVPLTGFTNDPQFGHGNVYFDGTYVCGLIQGWTIGDPDFYRYGPLTDIAEEEEPPPEPEPEPEEESGDSPSSTKAFIYNTETESFTIHDIDFLCHGEAHLTVIPFDILGTDAGQLLHFDDGFNAAAGTAIEGVVETADMAFDLPNNMKRISEVIPALDVQDLVSELMVQVGVRNRLSDDIKWSDPVPFTIGVSDKCDFNGFRKEGKFIRVRFYSDQKDSPWKMSGYTINYEIGGIR